MLSPHPDDAVLSCWHLLAGPGDVLVVNVFTAAREDHEGGGPPWWDRLTEAATSTARMRQRLAEDADALARVGRTAVNLGFLDGQHRRRRQAPTQIARRIAAVVHRETRLYAPAGLGGVADHECVRAAALELERQGYQVSLYADLPHAIQYGWPASVTGAAPLARVDVDGFWEATLERSLPGPAAPLRREVHVLDDCAQAAKRAAVRAYRTQLPALEAMNGRLRERGVFRYEATWRRFDGSLTPP